MRQLATVVCCVAFATVGWHVSKTYVVERPQNAVMASTPLKDLLSPIKTEVHDTVKVPDSIAYVPVPVPKPVPKYIIKYRDRKQDSASVVNNQPSEKGLRVTSPVSDTVSTDVQSLHTNTREVRKGTPPDSLYERKIEIRGYNMSVSETRLYFPLGLLSVRIIEQIGACVTNEVSVYSRSH